MAQGVKTAMGPVEWLMLVTFAFLWATSYFFTALGLRELPVMTFTLGRLIFSGVMLYAICRIGGLAMPRDAASWAAFTLMSLLNLVLPTFLIVLAQVRLPAGFAAIMVAATPFFTVLLAQVFTGDEKITGGKLAGVAFGFLGVGTMIGLSLLSGAGRNLWAELALLAAALSLACAGVYGRRFRTSGHSLNVMAAAQGVTGAIMFAPFALAIERPWEGPAPSLAALVITLTTAFLSGTLAPLVYFRLLSRAGATNVVLSTFLAPVFSIALSATFLGEHLEARHFAGMALIGLGLAAIDGRPWAALRRIRQKA